MRGLYVVLFGLFIANVSYNAVASPVDLSDTLLHILESLEDIKIQIKSLETAIEGKVLPANTGASAKDITNAILAHNFGVAERQMLEFNDRKIAQIVHTVYEDSTSTGDIILHFIKELTNSDVKLLVIAAFHEEIRATGHPNPFRLIALAETLEREQLIVKSHLKAKVQDELADVIESIKTDAVNTFKVAMIRDGYQNNTEIEGLFSAIFTFRSDLLTEVIEDLVDCVFGNVSTAKILDNISSHRRIPLVIAGLTAMFEKFHSAGDLNNNAVLDLASHLRDLQLRPDYETIDQEVKDTVERTIERLPTCARGLYFYSSVCLWNKGRREYMYAASGTNSYDSQRRTMFTWYSGNIVNGAVWHVEKIDGYYFFKNVYYDNEYLYSVNGGSYSKDMRYVFTWIPGHNTDRQSRWIIELHGDYCYVKTAYNNEYMFASPVKFNKLNSYVFTSIEPTIAGSEEHLWQLRNCDQGGN